MKREHSVRCLGCPIMVADLTKTKTQIRKELREDGWRVAVPRWATLDPASPEYRAALTSRKTVDICPACQQRRIDEAMERFNASQQQRQNQKLIDMPCSATIQ